MNDSFLKLVNPSFAIEWNDKQYQVKKATLEQVAKYQQRATQYVEEKTQGSNQLLAAYALFLILEGQIDGLTEETVLQNTAGDIDYIQLFTSLGFMNPARFQEALKNLQPSQTTENSGRPSPTAPDGLPETSAS